jgi:hypothetical protein
MLSLKVTDWLLAGACAMCQTLIEGTAATTQNKHSSRLHGCSTLCILSRLATLNFHTQTACSCWCTSTTNLSQQLLIPLIDCVSFSNRLVPLLHDLMHLPLQMQYLLLQCLQLLLLLPAAHTRIISPRCCCCCCAASRAAARPTLPLAAACGTSSSSSRSSSDTLLPFALTLRALKQASSKAFVC